ncbi:MAG: bifunctional DNA-formamidopyrimidine glycosylase/DNA-(apurinic or apyrimidinic site) lyase [Hoeflea sp.]|uniref:bifunctional DNA-formamidopyrimidine glycosylase/DNA-(apurinic or apyrimidinic site) lyase n=1 Tax=Hoeflea sp. TaxID=1940281 RepID=UPI001D6A3D61|nr:bifunctional DNA-formamidopyrimidine glycosylase/DNA-(apurinic or apyrimidinic site) lyase [Hoeflea sp.]MBU4531495.1 bifunctional DNA-formamidopyrimidine glycosylase/DNA-(apurinic or apyrimidinic site) lyase [Alphaproteobacteria bacterium]MBU4544352.1 bifunctional DNA-formamidopyrimidine glycosylase/DNA-(apurinic or apyrimidinic site) lyase [Alphaproteobacteria bacterium]MBU4550411.1 bifunctional DNA-formamidopyrimidine glycosylase/DNA-(apurinic or apyrimidinic site) lyase [Alphaproteobacteri
MPELPEVETVRRGLEPVMEGAQFTRVEQRRADLRFAFPEGFAARLEGRRVISLGRRAKYLLADLDDGMVLVCHLGMSGSFRIEAEGEGSLKPGAFHHARSKDDRHDHVVFHLEGPAGLARVIYNDPRRFGYMDLIARTQLGEHAWFRGLGVEPTGNSLDAGDLERRLTGKTAPLKAALLDQRIIAGLGNIYVCEAMWRAGLSPLKPAGRLVGTTGKPKAALEQLTQAIRAVIGEAIAAGGSSLRDHIRTDGTLGYFQHGFSVYDREGKACPRPGCGDTVRRIVQSGRSTFYCPRCQKN